MQADAHRRRKTVLTPLFGKRSSDGQRAIDGGVRAREGDEEPVAGVVDLLAVVIAEERADLLIVPCQQAAPCLVADRLDELRGAHDVGEHKGTSGPT